MTLVAEAGSTAPPAAGAARIGVLDVLRGIALLGMFLVHFNNYAVASDPPGTIASLYQTTVALFFEERFWTMFGILFGVGFAVQLDRAEARGAPFVRIYLRRLLALAVFGFLAHAVFGYNVLLAYAAWGVPLLLVRKWTLRILALALVISAASWSLYAMGHAGYRAAVVGEAAYRAERAATAAYNRRFNEQNRVAQEAAAYPAVLRARLDHMAWFYRQPFSFLPVNTFTLFLIGVIGYRLRLFDEPARHRQAIAAIAVFGVASWAAERWLLHNPVQPGGGSLVADIIRARLHAGFGIVRGTWLAFAYIGGVLLLVARSDAWLRWLAPFGWSGRTALTTYVAQIAILDLAFSTYALHLPPPTPLQSLGAALSLFAISAASSRWWLTSFQFGPLEWLWRSITYGRREPFRRGGVSYKRD